MLMPLPATLRRLVKDYETLLAEENIAAKPTPSARLRDLGYTLCVSTGTRDVDDALRVARTYLDSAAARVTGPEPRTALSGRRPVVASAAAVVHRPARPNSPQPATGR